LTGNSSPEELGLPPVRLMASEFGRIIATAQFRNLNTCAMRAVLIAGGAAVGTYDCAMIAQRRVEASATRVGEV
jgi:hypothetical protein